MSSRGWHICFLSPSESTVCMWVLRIRSLVLVLGFSFQTSGVLYLTMSNLQSFGTICALKVFTIHISSLELLPWTLHLCVQLPSAFSHGYPTNISNLFLWPLPPSSLPSFFLLCSWKLHYPTARKSSLLFLLSHSTFSSPANSAGPTFHAEARANAPHSYCLV